MIYLDLNNSHSELCPQYCKFGFTHRNQVILLTSSTIHSFYARFYVGSQFKSLLFLVQEILVSFCVFLNRCNCPSPSGVALRTVTERHQDDGRR
jgi:hypothetical protein